MNISVALDISVLQISKSGSTFPTGCKVHILATGGHLPYPLLSILINLEVKTGHVDWAEDEVMFQDSKFA